MEKDRKQRARPRRTWNTIDFVAVLAFGLASLATNASNAQDRPEATYVLPPGQEDAVRALLQGEGDGGSLAGCALAAASIERSVIEATYACAEHRVVVRVAHREDAPTDARRVGEIAVWAPRADAPDGLIDALAARGTTSAVHWQNEQRPPSGETGGLTASQQTRYRAALDLYSHHRHAEAFEAMDALARENPHGGVLGMLVANIAPLVQASTLARWTRAADAHPDDPLAQFEAGVAAHYVGHARVATTAEKPPYYRMALHYLGRVGHALDFEPRFWIYNAVSHYRLGEQGPAQDAIDHAVALGSRDPDVLYCRAEVLHRVDAGEAVRMLEAYLRLEDQIAAEGTAAPVNPEKHARVERMLRTLRDVAAGRASLPAEDLFDPATGVSRSHSVFGLDRTRFFATVALVVTFVLAAAVWFARRARGAKRAG